MCKSFKEFSLSQPESNKLILNQSVSNFSVSTADLFLPPTDNYDPQTLELTPQSHDSFVNNI
jgi:hypothetical protein